MSTYSIKTTAARHAGHSITLEWFQDPDMGPPWKEHDGHGTVSDWTTRDKRPSERVLSSDRRSKQFYDYAESLKTALADGWGLSEEATAKLATQLGRTPTRREIAARAVDLDFENLRDWCNDRWQWVGYDLTVTGPDGVEVKTDSLWGIDSPSMDYFEAEVMEDARHYIDREIVASHDAACRDITTV